MEKPLKLEEAIVELTRRVRAENSYYLTEPPILLSSAAEISLKQCDDGNNLFTPIEFQAAQAMFFEEWLRLGKITHSCSKRQVPVAQCLKNYLTNYRPPTNKILVREMIKKVVSGARGKRIAPYDYNDDGYNRKIGYYFCNPNPGCSAASFRIRHKEYMLIVTDALSGLGICPFDGSACTPIQIKSLSIYECAYRKNNSSHSKRDCWGDDVKEETCIYDDRYRKFRDGDADGILDILTIRRGGTEYQYNFEDGVAGKTEVNYRYAWGAEKNERKIRPHERKQATEEYETLLKAIAEDYGLGNTKK